MTEQVVFKDSNAFAGSTIAGLTRSYRQFITPLAGSSGQGARVTFLAPSTGALICAHAAFGIKGAATAPNSTSVPTELKFSGSSGFSILASASIVSDWCAVPWAKTDTLMVVMDMSVSTFENNDASPPAQLLSNWQEASYASYNLSTVVGMTNAGVIDTNITLIETNAMPIFIMPMGGI